MKDYLDDDVLMFAIKHGLPLNKSDYTKLELTKLKEKALQEQYNRKIEIERRKIEVLFG